MTLVNAKQGQGKGGGQYAAQCETETKTKTEQNVTQNDATNERNMKRKMSSMKMNLNEVNLLLFPLLFFNFFSFFLLYSPIAIGYVVHFGLEAIGVIPLVAAIAEQQLVLVLAGRAELAILKGV